MTIPWCSCGPGVATTSTSPFYLPYTCWESGPPDLTKPQEAPLQKRITHIATNINSFHRTNRLHVHIASLTQLELSENKEPWNWGYRNNYSHYRNGSPKHFKFPAYSFVGVLLCCFLGFFFNVSSTMICAQGFARLGMIHQLLQCCADIISPTCTSVNLK